MGTGLLTVLRLSFWDSGWRVTPLIGFCKCGWRFSFIRVNPCGWASGISAGPMLRVLALGLFPPYLDILCLVAAPPPPPPLQATP